MALNAWVFIKMNREKKKEWICPFVDCRHFLACLYKCTGTAVGLAPSIGDGVGLNIFYFTNKHVNKHIHL